ncbi:MAG: amidohydrolase family protein [Actinomycetia bacterium]|nr:amidohydrolase family protein [Actinomycetes bacterium]
MTVPTRRRFAVVGARVLPVCGPPLNDGVLVVADGRIESVGERVPEGVPRVDAAGCWLVPGMIDAHAAVGIVEEGIGWAGDDAREYGADAGLRASDAINPADLGLRDAIAGGVLAADVSPSVASPIGGQCVTIRCACPGGDGPGGAGPGRPAVGVTISELVLRDPSGVRAALGERVKRTDGEFPITRMGAASVIRAALTAGRDRLDRDRFDRDRLDGGGEPASSAPATEELAALGRVLRREIPLRAHAHRADDIATAMRIADEFGARLVIDRGTEAHLVADRLAERDVPVVLGPLVVDRRGVEQRGRTLRAAARLAAAGVRLAFTTGAGTIPVELLAHQACFAVREGLDPATAVAALTLEPARILGVDDRLGSLEPGKLADFCLWDGDPLDPRRRVLAAYIGGELTYQYG